MRSLLVLAALALVFGAPPIALGHVARAIRGRAIVPIGYGVGSSGHAIDSIETHDSVAVIPGENATSSKRRPPGNLKASTKADGARTIHYVVIPIDCRYLTKAAHARMCGRPIMRAASAKASGANTPH